MLRFDRRLVLVVAVALMGCVSRGGSIRLASIHQLETPEIIAGEEFKIFGDGFVPGEVQIVLEGTWLTPGREPIRRNLAFSGNAVTEREISTVLPLSTFRELEAPHALFEGSVHARFEASKQVRMGYIEALRNRVVLDILGNEPDGGKEISNLGERAGHFLQAMGVEGQSDPEGGFLLTTIEQAGHAEKAGLQTGDLVLVSRGMRVYSELDLLASPAQTSTKWVVARTAAESTTRLRTFDLEIPQNVRHANPDPVWIVGGAAAAALALLSGEVLTLLLLPLVWVRRTVTDLVARLRRRREHIVSMSDRPGAVQAPRSRWVQNMLALPVVLAAASGCAAVALTSAEMLHVAAVYALLVLLAWFTGFRASRSGRERPFTKIRRLLACLLAPAPVAIMFVWRGLFTLRPSLGALSEGQGLEPWTWHGLSDPFAFLMLVVGVLASGLRERRDVSLARHLAFQAYAVVNCAVITHLMLGGLTPLALFAEPGSPQATGAGLLLWLAKVLGLYLLVQAHVGDRTEGRTSDIWLMLGRPLVLTGALVGSIMLGPSMESHLPSLPHVTAAVGAAMVMLGASSRRRTSGTQAIRIRPW